MSERVVVLGVGLHPFGRHPEKSIGEMARVAALAAMKTPASVHGYPGRLRRPRSTRVSAPGSATFGQSHDRHSRH